MSQRGWGFDPFSEAWWRHRAGGRRRRGSRRWFEAGDMKYVILKLLRDRPMHGYEVMKELEDRTRGCYKPSPGTVYPTLQWLEDEGLVQADEVEGKKVYAITDRGRSFLDEHRTTVEDIFDRVEETIDNLVGDPMPEVTRLVGRVVGQAYRATWRLRADEARVKEVTQVLERAAEELEALVPRA